MRRPPKPDPLPRRYRAAALEEITSPGAAGAAGADGQSAGKPEVSAHGEFSDDLRALDAAVGDAIEMEYLRETPAGLEDRVFTASVPGLAERALVVVGRIRRAERWWGRLAVAAGLGLAAVLTATLVNPPVTPPPPNVQPVVLELDWLAYGPADDMAHQVGHLLEAHELDSHRAITGEIQAAIDHNETSP